MGYSIVRDSFTLLRPGCLHQPAVVVHIDHESFPVGVEYTWDSKAKDIGCGWARWQMGREVGKAGSMAAKERDSVA